MRVRNWGVCTATAALSLVMAGCSTSHHPSTPQSAPSPSTAITGNATPTGTPTPQPSAVATGGGRLAYARSGHMYIQRIDRTGHLVGGAITAGPADRSSVPQWSPLGRYLVWGSSGDLELFDSARDRLHTEASGADGRFAFGAASTGAVHIVDEDDQSLAVQFITMAGEDPSHFGGRGSFANGPSNAIVGHGDAIVETPPAKDGEAATLWLLPQKGRNVVIGHVQPVEFLSSEVPPGLGAAASTIDNSHAAVVTTLGQDGGCADGQTVHVLDLVHHTDAVIALPIKSGDLITPTYSPDGVLGGISADCSGEASDSNNSFAELHGTKWTTVVPGAVIGSRGPDGLLAVELGTIGELNNQPYTKYPSQDHPLEIRTANGQTVTRLPSVWSVGWTQTPIAPG